MYRDFIHNSIFRISILRLVRGQYVHFKVGSFTSFHRRSLHRIYKTSSLFQLRFFFGCRRDLWMNYRSHNNLSWRTHDLVLWSWIGRNKRYQSDTLKTYPFALLRKQVVANLKAVWIWCGPISNVFYILWQFSLHFHFRLQWMTHWKKTIDRRTGS